MNDVILHGLIVDEAYAEFSGVTFIPELKQFPNVVVGRTFSKAFGLAGLRIGAVVGARETLHPIRMALPVYSVNIAACVALPAALSDLPHLNSYLEQVAASKELLYAACQRMGATLTEIPVDWRDVAGSTFRVHRHSAATFRDVTAIWMRSHRERARHEPAPCDLAEARAT